MLQACNMPHLECSMHTAHETRTAHPWLASCVVLFGCALMASHASASPRLRCQIEQGYKTQIHEATPSQNPYTVQPVEVRSRFRFKAVVVGDAQHVDYVKLYTYYYLRGQAVLVHMVHYPSPAVSQDAGPGLLTGLQRVYSPQLGFEMQYQCSLYEVTP